MRVPKTVDANPQGNPIPDPNRKLDLFVAQRFESLDAFTAAGEAGLNQLPEGVIKLKSDRGGHVLLSEHDYQTLVEMGMMANRMREWLAMGFAAIEIFEQHPDEDERNKLMQVLRTAEASDPRILEGHQ